MQMLDSKGDNQRGANDYEPQNAQQQQSQEYKQPSYQQPQSNYAKPATQQAYPQNKQMPNNNSIPEIDIDDDEIPF
jgi:single-stranded DNA-binding protein